MRVLVKNATLIDPSHAAHGQEFSLLIEDGFIIEIGNSSAKADHIITSENLHFSRGWFDPLVSFGEPGYEERETIANGLHTAASSGFTHLGLLPNVVPVVDSQSGIVHQKTQANGATCTLHPLGALSLASDGKQLAELYNMQQAGALAFYDAFQPIHNPQLLKIALEYSQSFDGLLLSHPSNITLEANGQMHEGVTSTELGLKGIPSIAESIQINRDLELLENSGGRLHIPFISSAAGVAHIRAAKKKGLNVSCSVGLPHLFFDATALASFDANLKLFPPIRTQEDQKALREGLLDGTIDCVSSMHQPINPEYKELEFELALPGSIGLEACFGILSSLFPLEQAVRFLTRGKAIFSVPEPKIEVGQVADFTFFDPNQNKQLSPSDLLSTSKNCAFLGYQLSGKVLGCYNNKQLHWNANTSA
ncbi:MAG: dihydroorotase [Flavobacteriaceae bacterium]|nr:dihydroorotase [Flavobacteriaceae bacterium]